MSKMPAKKKSCFQITSVTQAQVAANSATDDTESLDDPDESRTEDVSSEIFDMSRTDFEPEVCDRSSSEETLNNVGESEAPGQLPAVTPLNGGFGMRHVVSVVHQGPGAAQVSNNAQPAAPASTAAVGSSQTAHVTNSSSASTATTTIASCSSRFRVIKLDHGSGEPFRRGRWTCTEYYEKDSEGSVMSRTVDSIRHTNVTEPGPDRDSGLGATVGSVMAQVGVSGQGPDTSYDGSSFTSPSHALDPQQPHSFSVATQQVVSGSGSPESFSNKSVPVSIQQQVQGSSHVPVPHNLHPPAHDGVHQGAHLQKSPSMPPAQVQSLLYQPQHQLPLTHHLQTQPTLISAGQPEYGQQHLPITVSQTHPGANLSFGHAVGQGPSPVPTPVAGGLQVLGGMGEMSGIPGGVPLGSQPVTSASAVGMVTPGMPTSGFSLADESRRMSDASAQILAVQNKDMMKPLITEGLQLPSPAVNSLFGISIPIDGEDDRNPSTAFFQAFQSGSKLKDSKMTCDSASGASVVAIDNKIEQAMDLVKSHLMYAVREEVEVLKEQIKELCERNSVLERENAVLKSLANNEQLSQLSVQSSSNPSNTPPKLGPSPAQPPPPQLQPQPQPYLQLDINKTMDSLPRQPQPNVTSA